jgi:MOSC domain-containing protein YiiM
MAGRVKQILVGAEAGSPLESLEAATLEAGRGVVGDRYYFSRGTFSKKLDGTPAIEATLIAQEEIDAFNTLSGRDYSGRDFRRNIVTEGVQLAGLIGREFRVGDATLRGMRFCEPCAHLSGKLGPEIMQHMVHKAGIRAQVVVGGAIRPSDGIED